MGGNYTYIVASIPVLSPEFKPDGGSCTGTLEWIDSQLGKADRQTLRMLRDGFDREKLTEEFYRTALQSKNKFIRSFFAADLNLRNAKVAYLNKALGREDGTDVIALPCPESTDSALIAGIFAQKDLLERERAIDNYLWQKADELTLFEYFSLDKILAIAAKLCIIERWLALDETTGRQMLRTLVHDVRGSYGNIEFETLK